MPKITWSETDKMKLAAMYSEGATAKQLTKQFKKPMAAIYSKAYSMGLKKVRVTKVPFPKKGEAFDDDEIKLLVKMVRKHTSPRLLMDEFCRPIQEIFTEAKKNTKPDEYEYLKVLLRLNVETIVQVNSTFSGEQ